MGDIAAWKAIADLGMGMVSLVALVVISLRLLASVSDTHKEVRLIRLELHRAIGYMQAYMSRQGVHFRKEDDVWTEKRS
ncbi:hypothetical protein [Meiothermus sp.]|uniref:hypothetical protein n=1 Tax=Meiothermus sp. TaxID=1955249 RepID=UPI0021DD786C|nr:hypothetical protein [Meiothermus sp.]GIW33777.1 MAG: hypothetical protein KatS3mg072_1110 [Meiothermus sp.]